MYLKKACGYVHTTKAAHAPAATGILDLYLEPKRTQLHEQCLQMAEPVLDELPACKSDRDVELLIERCAGDVGKIYWQLALSVWALADLTVRTNGTMPAVNLHERLCDAFDSMRLALVDEVEAFHARGEEPTTFAKLFDKFYRNLYDEIHRVALSATTRAISDNAPDKTRKASAGGAVYRFVASGDSCAACAALDGRIFPIVEASEGSNLPLIHPNCTCTAEPVDGSRNLSYNADDLVRLLGKMDFNKITSLLLDSSVFVDANGERSVSSGDQHILSAADYKTMLALDNLYRAFALVGDKMKADAVKYQMVQIRQKESYKNQYHQSDANGVYLDTYTYSNLSAAKRTYFVLEHLDEEKLFKHGGEGTQAQEAIYATMSTMISPSGKSVKSIRSWLTNYVLSLLDKRFVNPNSREWETSDYVDILDKLAEKFVPDYNPGKVLQEGDVYVYMAPNDQNKATGTDFFFREKELLYFKDQLDNKVRR